MKRTTNELNKTNNKFLKGIVIQIFFSYCRPNFYLSLYWKKTHLVRWTGIVQIILILLYHKIILFSELRSKVRMIWTHRVTECIFFNTDSSKKWDENMTKKIYITMPINNLLVVLFRSFHLLLIGHVSKIHMIFEKSSINHEFWLFVQISFVITYNVAYDKLRISKSVYFCRLN